MQTTSITELKNSLSAYLRNVKAGEEVLITDRGRPIARLVPDFAIPILLKSAWMIWRGEGCSNAGQGNCRKISGKCHDQRIRRDLCEGPFPKIEKKAGEILGCFGRRSPLFGRIHFQGCAQNFRRRP